MHNKKIFKNLGLLVIVTVMILDAGSCKGKSEKQDASVNPLIQEMVLLQDAYNTTIDVLVLGGDSKEITRAYHAVHEAKHNTEMALEKKEIKLPKNADQLESFVKLDGEFHELIEKLVEAANRNDRKAMRDLSKTMLDGCIGCHEEYRQ